jgi:hypothetical protein
MTKLVIQELDWDWRFFHIRPTTRTLPIGLPPLPLSLSNTLRGVSSNNDAELQNWLDEIFTAKPVELFKRGIVNLPERWEAS